MSCDHYTNVAPDEPRSGEVSITIDMMGEVYQRREFTMLTVHAGDKSCRVHSMRQAMPFLMDYLRPFLRGYHTAEDGRIALHDAMTRVKVTDDQGNVYTTNNSLALRKVA